MWLDWPLITKAIWWLVYHRAYLVYADIYRPPRMKVKVVLATELAAYQAAAELVRRFAAEGPSAVQGLRVDALAATSPDTRVD